jgi:hypothetical protein
MSTDLQVLAGTAPSGVRTVSLPSSLIKERGGIRLRSAVRLVSSMPTLSDIASVSNHAHSIVEKHSRTEITVTNDQAYVKFFTTCEILTFFFVLGLPSLLLVELF